MTSQSTQRTSPTPKPAFQERRQVARRLVRCRVAVTLANGETLYGFSVDMSRDGIRLAVPRALTLRQECSVALSVHVNGKTHVINAIGEILSCICSGMDGFQLGIRFVHIDELSTASLQQLFT